MESKTEPEDTEYGEDAHCRTTLHRPVDSPAKEAAENTVRAYQIGRTVKVAWTSEAAPLVKEEAEITVEASWIVGTAKVTGTLEAALVMHS